MIGSSLFSLFYAFLVGWFYWSQVWTDHYFEAGTVYIFYNAFRVAFLLYFTLILFVLGRKLLRGGNFLLASYVGAAVFEIVMVILGFLHLYYRAVALVLTLPCVFLSFPLLKKFLLSLILPRLSGRQAFPPKGERVRGRGGNLLSLFLMGMTLFLLLDLLVKKGLFPDIVGSDPVGHYLPYFNEVLARHHLWPNPYFLDYFYSKGAGLNFLALLLTDIQGSQLVSFYYLTLSTLTLYAVTRKMSFSIPWSCVAVIVYLKSFVIPLEVQFSKSHTAATFWFAAILWLTLTLLEEETKKRLMGTISLILITMALTFQIPVSLVFTLPYFLSLAVILWLKGEGDRAKSFFILSIATVLSMGIVFSFNYLTSGIMEFTPSNVFLPHANISVMKQSWSPYALLAQYEFSEHASAWRSPSLFRINAASFWEIFKLHLLRDFFPFLRLDPTHLLAVVIYPVLLIVVFIRRKSFEPYFQRVILCVGILSAVGLAILLSSLLATQEQGSLGRFAQFFSFYTTLVGLALWKLILSAFRKQWVRKKVSTLVVLLIFLIASFHYGLRGKRSSIERYPFLLGQKSFREAYGNWVPQSCLAVRSILGQRKVALLNSFPGCYSLPGTQFERPLMNSYVKDYHEAMFESAPKAKETFRRHGVDYFLVDLNRQFHLTAFSPLFHPKDIKRYLKIVWQADEVYLLTWRESGEEEMEESFLNSYASKYESESQSSIAKVHEKIRGIYQAKTWMSPRMSL